MRLAILSDIHGNLPAFEAALEHVAHQQVDRILLAGDIVVGAPDSAACWQLAQSLGCPMVRGNHERYVTHFGTPDANPLWSSAQFAPLHWAVQQLSADERQQMAALPPLLRLEPEDLLVVHASLRSDHDNVLAYTPESQLAQLFPEVQEHTIVRAHDHLGQIRPWGQRTIITAGSVGLPLDGRPAAQYLVLEQRASGWHIAHHAVQYDTEQLLRRVRESNYIEATGPIGRLYLRELMTATSQIVPFLHAYRRWSAENPDPPSLAAALERFLNLY